MDDMNFAAIERIYKLFYMQILHKEKDIHI